MRDKDMLGAIQDVAKLQEWMYASEENRITVQNGCGSVLELHMNDEGEVYARFQNSRFKKPTYYDSQLSLPIWLGIVEQLQKQPAVRPEYFASRWDEIVHESAAVAALNLN